MGETMSPGSSPLGRESELDQLFDDVRARGGSPEVTGAPAAGKPALLLDLLAESAARALPGLVLHHLLGPMLGPRSAQAPGSSPPTPAGSATPVMTIFGVPGEGDRDDRRIDRVLS